MNNFTNFDPIAMNSLEIISRQNAEVKFNYLYRQARLVKLWNRLTGRPGYLRPYEMQRDRSRGFYDVNRGMKSIPVKSIAGSVGRAGDYDQQFRPLKRALKERWINAHMLAESRGWEPILVHKIGDLYYVEDGHHRVSVARHMGMDTIEAQVYE